MIVGGIILMICGLVSLISGISANNNPMAQLQSAFSGGGGDPGTIWIVLGIIALIGGGILTSYGLKNKK